MILEHPIDLFLEDILISFIRFTCKKRRTAIVMHECDNSGVFNNIMRIFHSIPEPEILCPRARESRARACMCVWQSKYVKRSSGGLQCGEFRGAVYDYMESTVGLFVRLFGDLLATTRPGRTIAAGQCEFNSLIYSGLAEWVDR